MAILFKRLGFILTGNGEGDAAQSAAGAKTDANITNSNEELINLAYSMAVEPQRFGAFTDILNERALALSKTAGSNEDSNQQKAHENLSNIVAHFQHAFDLLERQGRRFNYATGSIRFVDTDNKPSALLHEDGTVFHANKAAISGLGLALGKKISAAQFTGEQHKRLLRDLKTIGKYETDKIISVYNLSLKDGGEQIKIALSKAVDYKNKPIGRLCTFHIKWMPERGKQFQEGFDLTPVDLAITKAIISGTSLKALAHERGRSLATIRTQTKALLSKLGLHSQVELACLYSGFTHFNLNAPAKEAIAKPKAEPWRAVKFLELPGERKLQYELVGPPNGRPVLYFHGLIDAMMVTTAIRKELAARNIRLIMVWRPFFAGTSPDEGVRGAPQRFAADIERLLNKLEIKSCQILGISQGGIYGYGCAQYMPARITGLVNCSTGIPITSRKQFKLMHPSPRIHILLARYSPMLLPMMVRAMLSKIDAGYDEEFLLEHYENSPSDLQTLKDQELGKLMRAAYPIYTAQGYMPFVRNAQIEASKWGALLGGVMCPVTLVHGDQHHTYPLSTVREFTKDKPNFTLLPIRYGGQLLYYQHTSAIYEALDAQYANTQNS